MTLEGNWTLATIWNGRYVHIDPADNCIPISLTQARTS